MKIKELIPSFIQNCIRIGLRPNTVESHRNLLTRVVLPVLGDFDIKDLLPIHRSLVLEKATPMGASVPQRSMVSLRCLLAYARDCGYRSTFHLDEMKGAQYFRVKPVEALDKDEIAVIRSHLSNPPKFSKYAGQGCYEANKISYARTLCFFEFLLHTGVRLSEALAVNIQDLNWKESSLKILNEKTRKWRTVYFYGAEKAIQKYLETRKDGNPALFVSNTGKRLSYATAQSSLKSLKKRLKLRKHLSHHIFRKTFVTTLFRAKVDPKEVQVMAGHASLRTTLEHYYEVDLERLQPIHKKVIGEL